MVLKSRSLKSLFFFVIILIFYSFLVSRKVEEGFTYDNLNFEFCKILSNANFHREVYINSIQGTLQEINPPPYIFVKIIDTAAENFYGDLKKQLYPALDEESASRFACYAAVSGRTMNQQGVSRGACN